MSTILFFSVAAQPDALRERIHTLLDSRGNEYRLLPELRRDHSDAEIIEALVRALRDDEGFKEHYARVRGFTMLLKLGTMTPEGKKWYTHDQQIQLLLDELANEAPSSIQTQIINSLSCIRIEDRARFLEILPRKLTKPMYWLVRSSVQELMLKGDEKTPGKDEIQKILIDPRKANPAMVQALADLAGDEGPELLLKLRIEAARARIALGSLKDDLLIYPTLDKYGKMAAASAILSHLGCGCSMLNERQMAADEDVVRAIDFATEYFNNPNTIEHLPKESLQSLSRLIIDHPDPGVKGSAQHALQTFGTLHPDAMARKAITDTLQAIEAQVRKK